MEELVMSVVKIGIIGVGGIAQGVHIPQILNIKEAKITAICDIDEIGRAHV